MSKITVKTYVICLGNRKQNPKNINSWVDTFADLVHFKAVDGKTVDLTDRDIVHSYANIAIQTKEKNETVFAVPSRGAIGCFLSHYKLWKKIASSKEPAIVMEEDVYITTETKEKLQTALENMKHEIPDHDFVSLMYISQPHSEKKSQHFLRINGPRSCGTQLYYLTPNGAEKLIKYALPIFTQPDLYIGTRCFDDSTFHAYCLKERLYSIMSIVADNFKSSIQGNFTVKKYLPRSNKFFYTIFACLFVCIILIIIMMS